PICTIFVMLSPEALAEVESQLLIDPLKCFYINLENDRSKVKIVVYEIKSVKDYQMLNEIL
ncbi:hypothetical protein C8Q75DRAFT_706985, partial [Abortiporus biennis]